MDGMSVVDRLDGETVRRKIVDEDEQKSSRLYVDELSARAAITRLRARRKVEQSTFLLDDFIGEISRYEMGPTWRRRRKCEKPILLPRSS